MTDPMDLDTDRPPDHALISPLSDKSRDGLSNEIIMPNLEGIDSEAVAYNFPHLKTSKYQVKIEFMDWKEPADVGKICLELVGSLDKAVGLVADDDEIQFLEAFFGIMGRESRINSGSIKKYLDIWIDESEAPFWKYLIDGGLLAQMSQDALNRIRNVLRNWYQYNYRIGFIQQEALKGVDFSKRHFETIIERINADLRMGHQDYLATGRCEAPAGYDELGQIRMYLRKNLAGRPDGTRKGLVKPPVDLVLYLPKPDIERIAAKKGLAAHLIGQDGDVEMEGVEQSLRETRGNISVVPIQDSTWNGKRQLSPHQTESFKVKKQTPRQVLAVTPKPKPVITPAGLEKGLHSNFNSQGSGHHPSVVFQLGTNVPIRTTPARVYTTQQTHLSQLLPDGIPGIPTFPYAGRPIGPSINLGPNLLTTDMQFNAIPAVENFNIFDGRVLSAPPAVFSLWNIWSIGNLESVNDENSLFKLGLTKMHLKIVISGGLYPNLSIRDIKTEIYRARATSVAPLGWHPTPLWKWWIYGPPYGPTYGQSHVQTPERPYSLPMSQTAQQLEPRQPVVKLTSGPESSLVSYLPQQSASNFRPRANNIRELEPQSVWRAQYPQQQRSRTRYTSSDLYRPTPLNSPYIPWISLSQHTGNTTPWNISSIHGKAFSTTPEPVIGRVEAQPFGRLETQLFVGQIPNSENTRVLPDALKFDSRPQERLESSTSNRLPMEIEVIDLTSSPPEPLKERDPQVLPPVLSEEVETSLEAAERSENEADTEFKSSSNEIGSKATE